MRMSQQAKLYELRAKILNSCPQSSKMKQAACINLNNRILVIGQL